MHQVRKLRQLLKLATVPKVEEDTVSLTELTELCIEIVFVYVAICR